MKDEVSPFKIFAAKHPHWEDEICLWSNGRMQRSGGDRGSYQFREQECLVLKWDRWPSETLIWNQSESSYRAESYPFVAHECPDDVLRVNFANFWPGFKWKPFLRNLLPAPYHANFRLSRFPQLVFESVFGPRGAGRRRWPKAKQVWFTGENVAPPLDPFDYCLSFHRDQENPRHLRWPLFLLQLRAFDLTTNDLTREKNADEQTGNRPKFCAFIAANGGCQVRNRFVRRLSEYRTVDCPGSVLNNMPGDAIGPRGDKKAKVDFLRQYKFVVCFENKATRGQQGYVTEKILDGMVAGCIPLYWGDHRVGEDFNARSFIDLSPLGSDVDAMVKRVMQVDQDERLCQQIAREPWFSENRVPCHLQDERIVQFFHEIRESLLADSQDMKPRSSIGWISTDSRSEYG